MKRAQQLQERYTAIRGDCVIVAACDNKHMPYLVNALASMKARFPDHPPVLIHDIGLSGLNRAELAHWPGVRVVPVPAFVSHWRLNWSWKLHALVEAPARYVLYLDLANFVFLRSLSAWFLSVQRCGYLLLGNGQRLGDITPTDYWQRHDLSAADFAAAPTFGAGIVGFDRQSQAFNAIRQAHAGMLQGLNLGRSADEPNRKYKPALVRDCPCFRADQTLLNLAFRQAFGQALCIRRVKRYGGQGGASDHTAQYLWYARQNPQSMTYVFSKPWPQPTLGALNRLIWYFQLSAIEAWRAVLKRLSKV
jgi:hypothetical protein